MGVVEFLSGAVFVLSFGLLVAAKFLGPRFTQSKRLLLTARNDELAEQVRRRWNGEVSFVLWAAERRFDVAVVGGTIGKLPSHTWTFSMSSLPSTRGTTLELSLAGYMSIVRNDMGLTDISIGEKAFDLDFDIKSRSPERVQSLLSHAPVRAALRPFFRDPRRSAKIRIDGDGHLDYRFEGDTLGVQTRHEIITDLAALATLIEQHTATLPAATPASRLLSEHDAARAASGSPVAFGAQGDDTPR